MKTSALKTVLKAALLSVLPATALAEPVQEWRCTTDSLDVNQALLRIEWARKCGLLTNGSATTPNVAIGADTTITSSKAFDQNFQWAKDYKEANTNRAFTGNLNNYNVDYYFAYAKFESTPMYTVTREPSGPTLNYWKWANNTVRARPLYPSFESTAMANAGTQLFPHPTLNDCRLYSDKAGTMPWTGSHYVIAH